MKYVQDPETLRLVPASEYRPPAARLHYVSPDIGPYRSMQTGEVIGSRSKHRDHLKRHALIEVGNEVKAITTTHRKPFDRELRKRQIADAMNNR